MTTQYMPHARSGFSLVELSIVIIILGLLVGGVMAGTSLIRNAELKKLATEVHNIKQAVSTFRQMYKALPGDMANARDVWGTDVANGNGNMRVDSSAVGNAVGAIKEELQFWRHLGKSGLIEGDYAGALLTRFYEAGVNVPELIPNTVITINNMSCCASDSMGSGMYYVIGGLSSGASTSVPAHGGKSLLAKEIHYLDVKYDDGEYTTGHISRVNIGTSCAIMTSNRLNTNRCLFGWWSGL